jgi:hypothetical protein
MRTTVAVVTSAPGAVVPRGALGAPSARSRLHVRVMIAVRLRGLGR